LRSLLPLFLFFLSKEPKLLHGYEIQLTGAFVRPSREDIALIIRAGGGKVVSQLFRQDNYTQDGHNSTKSLVKKHVLVYDQVNEGVLKVKKLRTEVKACMELARPLGKKVDVVTSGGLLNCIAQYDLDLLKSSSAFL